MSAQAHKTHLSKNCKPEESNEGGGLITTGPRCAFVQPSTAACPACPSSSSSGGGGRAEEVRAVGRLGLQAEAPHLTTPKKQNAEGSAGFKAHDV